MHGELALAFRSTIVALYTAWSPLWPWSMRCLPLPFASMQQARPRRDFVHHLLSNVVLVPLEARLSPGHLTAALSRT